MSARICLGITFGRMNKKSRLWTFAALALAFLVLWGICNVSSLLTVLKFLLSVLVPILAGFSIAFILNIPLRLLEKLWVKLFSAKRKGLCRTVCILICFLTLGALAALLLWAVLPQIVDTVEHIIDNLPMYIEKIKGWYASFAAWLKRFSINLPAPSFNTDAVIAWLKEYFLDNGHHIIGTSVDIIASVFSTVFDTVIAFVIAIYVLAQKETLARQTRKLLYGFFSEKNAEKILDLSKQTEKTFSRFITGQLTEALIIGALCFVGMLVLRMPYAALISMLVGITALIPIFGAFIGTGIGAFLILFESPIKALWFVIFIIVLQQLEGNLIYPRVVGSQVGLPGLWVLIAVTVGSEFGIVGMLVSVPIVSLLYTLAGQFINAKIKEKGLEDEFCRKEEPKKIKKNRKKKNKTDNKNSESESSEI